MKRKINFIKWGVIILDESHYLKNPKTSRVIILTSIIQKCKRVILLSGTPSSNRPIELFSQLRLINKYLFTNQKKFGRRYCDAKQTHFGWDYRGHSNLNELHAILTNQV